jgi:hypothetical protein
MKTSDLLIATLFFGGIAHLMIFMNGYWNENLWLSVILNVVFPLAIYEYLNIGKKKKQDSRLSPMEI